MYSYLNKDRTSIYNALVENVKTYTDAWVPGIQSDPGEVFLRALADVADSIFFLQDRNILETYISTVTERKNAQRILDVIGYQLRWRQSGMTQVTISHRSRPEGWERVNFEFNLVYGTTNQLTSLRGAVNSRAAVNYVILPKGALEAAFGTDPNWEIGKSDAPYFEAYAPEDPLDVENGMRREPIVRWAVQGNLRTLVASVADIRNNSNSLKFTNPAIDLRFVWVYDGVIYPGSDKYTVWRRVRDVLTQSRGFPGFSLEVDEYDTPVIRFNSHLEVLSPNERITVLYLESSGAAGNVNKNAFNSLRGIPTDQIYISNPSNVISQYQISETGRDAMTAREAFLESRLYQNTHESLITLYDYRSFLARQLNVAFSRCADGQKMREINNLIFNDRNLPNSTKVKKYLWMDADMSPTFVPPHYSGDFPGQEKEHPIYTLACFLAWRNFQTSYSDEEITSSEATIFTTADMVYVPDKFFKYLVSSETQQMVMQEHTRLGALSVELRFCYYRVFPFLMTGIVYPSTRITVQEACELLRLVYVALGNIPPKLFSYSTSTTLLDKAHLIGVVESVRGVNQFDLGTVEHPRGIYYTNVYTNDTELVDIVDIEYVNYVSTYLYQDPAYVKGVEINQENFRSFSIKVHEGSIIDLTPQFPQDP